MWLRWFISHEGSDDLFNFLEQKKQLLVGGLVAMNLAFSQKYWESHHPNWRSHIFQRGGEKPPTRPRWKKRLRKDVVTQQIIHWLVSCGEDPKSPLFVSIGFMVCLKNGCPKWGYLHSRKPIEIGSSWEKRLKYCASRINHRPLSAESGRVTPV